MFYGSLSGEHFLCLQGTAYLPFTDGEGVVLYNASVIEAKFNLTENVEKLNAI